MPSKSRVVRDQRKTEEIIQAYGHEATPENLALFNGVMPTRVLLTPSHDTGAEATYIELKAEGREGALPEVSPIDGLAPADINKSRDSKPGGLNTIPTKHEESIKLFLETPPPVSARTVEGEDAGIDPGTYITPDVVPSTTPAGVPLMSAEEKASAHEAAQARKAEVQAREEKAMAERKKQAEQQAQAQQKSSK